MANSSKKAKASQKNGSKSKGPKTEEGKTQSSQNAIQDGLFARQVVIERLGEREKDFDELKKQLFATLQPLNTLEQMLVMDFAENWWRRERIRRAEAIELRNRYETARLRRKLDAAAQVEELNERLLLAISRYEAAVPGKDRIEVREELEEIRQQLNSTTAGVQLLLGILEEVKKKAKKRGLLSSRDKLAVLACAGFENQDAKICLALNEVNRKIFSPEDQERAETAAAKDFGNLSEDEKQLVRIARHLRESSDRYKAEKNKNEDRDEGRNKEQTNQAKNDNSTEPAKPGQPAAEDSKSGPSENLGSAERNDACDMDDIDGAEKIYVETARQELEAAKTDKALQANFREVLAGRVEACRRPLTWRKSELEVLEETQAVVAPWLALIDPATADRFSRAETAVERRMYRALAALAAMRAQEPPVSPGALENGQK